MRGLAGCLARASSNRRLARPLRVMADMGEKPIFRPRKAATRALLSGSGVFSKVFRLRSTKALEPLGSSWVLRLARA